MRTILTARVAKALGALSTFAALGCLPGCSGADTLPDDDARDDDPSSIEQTGEAPQRLPTCVTIARGVLGNIRDTQLASEPTKQSKNYGAGLANITGKLATGLRQTLVDVDLSPIPAGATIDQAVLKLDARLDSVGVEFPLSAHRVNVGWTESTVSWASFHGSPAPQFVAAAAASTPGGPGTHAFDITALVSAWLAGAPNHGVFIEQSNGYTNFYTSEDASVANRPRLDVCYTPAPPPPGHLLAAGHYHSLAVKPDGTLWAWGQNDTGQLGDGTKIDRKTPVKVVGLTNVVDVAGGQYNSVALKSDGTVWTWGHDGSNQLAIPTTTPIQVNGLSGVVTVSAGVYHTLALKSDGTVWAWGGGGHGALGTGTTNDSLAPVQVTGLSGVTGIAAGSIHSLAVKSDGTVWAWGANYLGNLGDGTTTRSLVPVQAVGLGGAVAVAAGTYHSVALKSDGTVWAWGTNGEGELGNGTTVQSSVPVGTSGLTGVVAITAGIGGFHSFARKADGSMWAWGWGSRGQLGLGTNTDSLVPVPIGGVSGVTELAAGYTHSLARTSNGAVWSWGFNDSGQLGNGNKVTTHSPAPSLFP